VCGGLGEYFDVDPVLVRVGFVLLAVFTAGTGLLLYLAGWLVIPAAAASEEQTTPLQGRMQRPDGVHLGALVFGLIVIAVGALWLLHAAGVARVDIGVALAVALAVIGAVLVGTLGRASTGGLIVLGIALTVLLAGTMSIEADPDTAFGDRVERPTSVDQLKSTYSHTLGSMTLDFTQFELPVGTTTTESISSFGSVTIFVPSGVGVKVDAKSSFGSVHAFGQEIDGVDAGRVIYSPGYATADRKLDLKVRSAFGSVEVIQR
jgi:phage shock protein PspC (stress-responsive transcriptional regulator)